MWLHKNQDSKGYWNLFIQSNYTVYVRRGGTRGGAGQWVGFEVEGSWWRVGYFCMHK